MLFYVTNFVVQF